MYWRGKGGKRAAEDQIERGSWRRQGEWHVNKSICFIDDILAEIFAKCHKVYDLSLLFDADCATLTATATATETATVYGGDRTKISLLRQRSNRRGKPVSQFRVYMQIFHDSFFAFTPTKVSSAWHLEEEDGAQPQPRSGPA